MTPAALGPSDAPAPELTGAVSVWGLRPADLAALVPGADPGALFAKLQRVTSWRDDQPVLGKRAAAALAHLDFSRPEITERHASSDGSTRLVLRTRDGRLIEAVHMPRAVKNPRVTVCVSSQVGCAMACTFCATGTMGIVRNLTAGEIVGEVLSVMAAMGPEKGHQLTLVFMGMGEPLHNYAAVARALTLLTHPDGIALSKRRVTLSTSGLVPEIDRLGRDFGGEVQLAVSLHSPDDAQRSEIMPINKKHPLPELMEALRRYPLPKRRRITIEYTLIQGFNASPTDAKKLAELLRGLPVKVNLIPLNRVEGNPLEPPGWDDVDAFQAVLRDRGVANFVRRRKGDDIAAACGQLALRNEPKKIRVALPQLRSR
jgi:23S rRNA (adenine2503-C2)-methyltransferase